MITTHEELRAAARTVNTDPTETEQSEAHETDLNIILTRYAQSGTIQSHGKPPMFEDWTQYPEDLRGFIEAKHDLERARLALPPELRDIPTDELLYMTPEAINARLPKPKPAPEIPTQPGLQPENAPSGK